MASRTTTPFLKTAACPASATLLSFRGKTLSTEAEMLVTDHLKVCDFCNAELPLLAHFDSMSAPSKTPEIPMDLRILAESIFSHIYETGTLVKRKKQLAEQTRSVERDAS